MLHKRKMAVLASLVFGGAAIAPIGIAYAYCNDPGAPCSLQAITEDYQWGIGHGVYNHAYDTYSGTVTLTGNHPPISIAANRNAATIILPHSIIDTSVVDSGGQELLEVYVYTDSSYAPNGDSGTFLFNGNGELVSGSSSSLLRIRKESYWADEDVFDTITYYASDISADSWGQAGLCVAGWFGWGTWLAGWLAQSDEHLGYLCIHSVLNLFHDLDSHGLLINSVDPSEGRGICPFRVDLRQGTRKD